MEVKEVPIPNHGGVLHSYCLDDFMNFYSFKFEVEQLALEMEELYGHNWVTKKLIEKELDRFANMKFEFAGAELSAADIIRFDYKIGKIESSKVDGESTAPECRITSVEIVYDLENKSKILNNINLAYSVAKNGLTISQLIFFVKLANTAMTDDNLKIFVPPTTMNYCKPKCHSRS